MLDSTDSVVYFENILFYYKRRFFFQNIRLTIHIFISKNFKYDMENL